MSQSLEAIIEMQDYLLTLPADESARLIGWLCTDLPRDPFFHDQVQEFRAQSAANFPERGDDRKPQSRCSSSQKQAGKNSLIHL